MIVSNCFLQRTTSDHHLPHTAETFFSDTSVVEALTYVVDCCHRWTICFSSAQALSSTLSSRGSCNQSWYFIGSKPAAVHLAAPRIIFAGSRAGVKEWFVSAIFMRDLDKKNWKNASSMQFPDRRWGCIVLVLGSLLLHPHVRLPYSHSLQGAGFNNLATNACRWRDMCRSDQIALHVWLVFQ